MNKISAGHADSQSLDVVTENIEKLKALFPTIVKEGKLDVEELKALLGDYVETGDEFYRFTWAGKAMARQEANKPSTATLRPNKEESKDWDTTENIFIEGDNLEVLKLLQKSYASKIKMIYIDPPYNTGKDFVYKDNYADNLGNYLAITGQTDKEGRKLGTNSDTDGRYHSNWLNMMYPRLKLARNLLKDDGAIFISISDIEIHNLKKVCDEIFGEENLLAQFVWRTDGNFDNQAKVKYCHEFILAYCKNERLFPSPPTIDPGVNSNSKLFNEEIRNTIVKNGPANPVSEILLPIGFPADFEHGIIKGREDSWPKYKNDAIVEGFKLTNETIVESGWSSKDLALEFISKSFNEISDSKGQETRFLISKTGSIEVVKRRSQNQSHVISVLTNLGNTQSTSAALKADGIYFDYPKPIPLVKYLVSMNEDKNYYVLDFFSGSGTTAHAVMQLNSEDGGNRKCISVQLPEPLEKEVESYKTIADITKERIRRVGEKIKTEAKTDLFSDPDKKLDIGFKAFKLDSSNINAWDGSIADFERNLFNSADNIKSGRSEEDVLYEILLKNGLDLTLPITTQTIAGKTVYNIGEGALFICLANGITTAVAEGIGQWKETLQPAICKVIFKDNGFTDVEKTNSIQILKRYGILEVNSI